MSNSPDHDGTRLENVEDLRRWLEAEGDSTPPGEAALGTSRPREPDDDVDEFRPIHRLPLAMLCVLDDSRRSGEWIRLRSAEFVIGRDQGDLQIPHDTLISGTHVKLVRHQRRNQHVWQVVDLNSRNGTFARVASARLTDGQETLIGSHRYRFQQGSASATAPPSPPGRNVTGAWASPVASPGSGAMLIEATPSGDGTQFSLQGSEVVIGRDQGQCQVVTSDRYCNRKHARLHLVHGQWHVSDLKSRNGTWSVSRKSS